MKRTVRLSATVLVSTLFMSPQAQADPVSSVYAEPVPNPQLTSTINPQLEITATGQLNATGIDGFQIDTPSATVTIDANNVNLGNNAIIATDPGNGINIINAAGMNSAANITINSGSAITVIGTGAGILVGDTGATITNAGTINGGNSAIDIAPGGTNTTIANSGTLQAGTTAGVLVEGFVANGGSGLTLTNSGAINATGSADAVQLNQNFNSVTNNAGSFITATNGSAINLAPTASGVITGDIENFGTIQSSGSGQGISITNPFNGTINNNSGGLIQATGTLGNVILANSSFGAINNNGTISATGSDYGINVTGNSPGTINNAGVVQTKAVSLLYNTNTASTGFNNTGTITSTSAASPTILARDVTTVNGIVVNGVGYGIVNSGTISNTGGAPAIDLQTSGNNINVPLLQQGGTITGNVLLASAGGTVLTMTGGTIAGNISSSNANASTLNFNGGTVTGSTQLGNPNNNVVNLGGTSLQALTGGINTDTFNLSGGSFTSLNGNGGGGDTINVTGPFTQNGTVNKIPTINVLNGGTYTVNSSISADTTTFDIKSGGSMITNFNNLNTPLATISINSGGGLQINNGSTFTALSANNSGTLTTNGGVLGLTGYYSQANNAILAPVIISQTDFGKVITTGPATFAAGSIMMPSLNSGGTFIPAGTQFQVVTANAVTGAPTLVQPQSALVFFTQMVNPNNIILTLGLRPVSAVAQGDVPQAVGTALDGVLLGGTTNPELLAVIGELEQFPDSTSLSNALLTLSPPFNYALPTSTRIVMDNAFDSVQQRLEELHGLGPVTTEENYKENRDYELYNGVNYGDINVVEFGVNHFNIWAKVDGTIIDQHKRNQIEGFLANSAGVAIGGDWRLTPQAVVGLAVSDTKVNTTDRTSSANKIDLQSYQATFYGWFEPFQSIYLDTMLAYASHRYDTTRYIQVGNFAATATAEFLGTEYGAQADLGYAFLTEDNWYISPYLRFRYTYLDIDNYAEKGAGGVGLFVKNQPIDETIGGIGIRIAAKRDYITAVYVPEASATLLYDFAGTQQEMQAAFLGFTVPFYVDSIKPAQLIQLYSFGISAYTTDGYCFTAKVNFEHREQLFGYNGYFQLNYMWD